MWAVASVLSCNTPLFLSFHSQAIASVSSCNKLEPHCSGSDLTFELQHTPVAPFFPNLVCRGSCHGCNTPWHQRDQRPSFSIFSGYNSLRCDPPFFQSGLAGAVTVAIHPGTGALLFLIFLFRATIPCIATRPSFPIWFVAGAVAVATHSRVATHPAPAPFFFYSFFSIFSGSCITIPGVATRPAPNFPV